MTAAAGNTTPDVFGPYEVHERLGLGGMAMVHRAKKRGIEGFERSVALKRMLQHLAEDPNFVDSFIREAKVASLLQHPNIAQVYDFGRIAGVYYIAMELVAGFDIRKLLRYANKTGESIPMPVVLSILAELADALEYAHTFIDETGQPLRIVHRDISPSNLVIAHTGHLKVIDFGIAKANSHQLHTASGQIKGKLGYMSPEAALGLELEPVSDVFSMGVVAWELVTASPLFSARSDYETMRRIREADIVPPSMHNPSCPAELDSIIVASLDRDSRDRLPTAGVFRAAIDALATQHGIHVSARNVAEWILRFAQPGDLHPRASTSVRAATSPLPQPPDQLTAVERPAPKLRRSADQLKLASEIWGDDMAAAPASAGPDFSMQIAQPPASTGSIPSLAGPPESALSYPSGTPTGGEVPRRRPQRVAYVILAILAVIAGVLVAVLVRQRTQPDDTPAVASGPVHFVIEPVGAIIEVGGQEIAQTSPFDTELAPGVYSVAVRREGYRAWTGSITVRAGSAQTVDVALVPEQVAAIEPPPPAVEDPPAGTPEPPGAKPPIKKPTVATTDHRSPKPEVEPPKPVVVDPPTVPPDAPPKPEVEVKPPPPIEPPKPDKPVRTPVVSSSAVTKLAGELPTLRAAGSESNGDVLVKMCIDEVGRVTSVRIIKTTAEITDDLARALKPWRYKPYVNQDGQPSAVCFPLNLRLVFKRGN